MSGKVLKVVARNRAIVADLGKRLQSKGIRISLESQQLQTVGLMPAADLTVIETDRLGIGDVADILDAVHKKASKSSFMINVKENESVEERSQRERFEKILSDSGADVKHNTDEVYDSVVEQIDKLEDDAAI